MRFVPLAGLLMASPVVLQAVQGERDVRDALVVWLVAMVLGIGGVVLFRAATSTSGPPAPPTAPQRAPPPRGGLRLTPARRRPRCTPSRPPTLGRCWS